MSWLIPKTNKNNFKEYQSNKVSYACCTLINIRDITTELQNIKIRGLVISKRPLRIIRVNYENSINSSVGFKGVFSFTLRDSVTDFVNITSWGKSEFSKTLFESFHIGDVMLVSNPTLEKKNSKYGDYEVHTSCNFNLKVNDKQSRIEQYYGGDRNNLLALQSTLLHSMSDHVTLLKMIRYVESSIKDIQIKGEHFTFLAMVREISNPQDLLSKSLKDENNQSKILHKLDVTLMDESCQKFPITIWDVEWINFAKTHWTPGFTVLSFVDCKVKYDDYKRGIIGVVDSRTIAILNPDIMESHKLRHLINIQKALTCEMNSSEITASSNELIGVKNKLMEADIPLSSIQNVLTIKSLLSRSIDIEYGIVYAVLSKFNIDCEDPFKHFVNLNCQNCKKRITINQLYCTTIDCPMIGKNVSWDNRQSVEVEFNLVINITDHTGTLNKCLLSGRVMEEFLECNPYQLIETDMKTRSQMKWNFFLNRYKFYVKNSLPSFDNSNPYTKVLGIRKPTVYEILASVKE